MVFTSALFAAFLILIMGTLLLCGWASKCLEIVIYAIKNRNESDEKKSDLDRGIGRNSSDFRCSGNLTKKRLLSVKKLIENRQKNANVWILFLGSLAFYSILHPVYLLLILATITLDWAVARLMDGKTGTDLPSSIRQRKVLLGVSLIYNLGILGFFKYFVFLAKNGLKVIHKVLPEFQPILPEILLPLGISFFTFQSMSYTIDVYRRVIRAERSWVRYGFYLSFFPQLVAGPIVKAKDFLPQIGRPIAWNKIPLLAVMGWIGLGILKKAVLADRLSGISDFIFANPSAVDWAFAWMGVFAYSFQIFLDFSGYSDIAIGIALFLGYRLPVNFSMPYLSAGFSEFWRRWHISLSSWLRDYLYVSLGGNRHGAVLTYRNLFLVMLLGGLWHGASWNFVIWGIVHGILLAVERATGWDRKREEISGGRYAELLFAVRAVVFLVVSLVWVFFRSPDWNTTVLVFSKVFSMEAGVSVGHGMKNEFFLVVSTLAIGHFFGKKGFHPMNWETVEFRPVLHSLCFSVGLIVMTLLAVPGKPFIYFVF